MRLSSFVQVTFILLLSTPFAAQQANRTPVVVELFTAEECSSCPPADALLARLSGTDADNKTEVVILGEHVDYWTLPDGLTVG